MLTVLSQPNGKIVAGGYFGALGGTRLHIGRLTATGGGDSTFNPAADDVVNVTLLQPDGKLLVGGAFQNIRSSSRSYLARLIGDASSTIDNTFIPNPDGTVTCLAMQPDGKILVAGNFGNIAGQSRLGIARLNDNGTVDPDFDPGTDGLVTAMLLQPDGKILIGGEFQLLAGQSRSRIGRLISDGSIDASFNPGADGQILSMALLASGNVVMAGAFHEFGGQPRRNSAACCRTVAWTRRSIPVRMAQ